MQVLDQPLTLFARGEVAPIPMIIVSAGAAGQRTYMYCPNSLHLNLTVDKVLVTDLLHEATHIPSILYLY